METKFSIKESLKFGWHKTKAHSTLLFQGLLTLFALEVAYLIVGRVLEGTFIGVLASIAIAIAQTAIGIGFTVIALKIASGDQTRYGDILPPWSLFWRYVGASILTGLLIVLGFILLIVPGIYLMLRFSMVRFALIEGKGVLESMRVSGEMTRNVKWRILLFFIAMGLLNILGFLCLLVGLLVTVPVTTIAYAHIYRKLKGHTVEAA